MIFWASLDCPWRESMGRKALSAKLRASRSGKEFNWVRDGRTTQHTVWSTFSECGWSGWSQQRGQRGRGSSRALPAHHDSEWETKHSALPASEKLASVSSDSYWGTPSMHHSRHLMRVSRGTGLELRVRAAPSAKSSSINFIRGANRMLSNFDWMNR